MSPLFTAPNNCRRSRVSFCIHTHIHIHAHMKIRTNTGLTKWTHSSKIFLRLSKREFPSRKFLFSIPPNFSPYLSCLSETTTTTSATRLCWMTDNNNNPSNSTLPNLSLFLSLSLYPSFLLFFQQNFNQNTQTYT